MYDDSQGAAGLFRRSGRVTGALGDLGAFLLTRHLPSHTLPPHTLRRVAVSATLTVAFLAAPAAGPIALPAPAPESADALSPTRGGLDAAPAAQPRAASATSITSLPPPMPATGLMATAPPLPVDPARSGRTLMLTFDDGPDPRWTPQVLALLRKYDARAVFCVVGSEARRYPELIRAIVGAGHELCNHSMNHDENLALRPGADVRLELAATQELLRSITGGSVPRYVRAPEGRWSTTLVTEAGRLGLAPLDWSVDPRDWSRPGLRHIVDTVLRDAAPQGVVVLHDGGGNRTQSMQALSFLLPRLRRLGYDFR
ncbi:MAG TPA: polysaccharide deacetylase family protein [Mycobacteriales bacterium]|nr:polysaccharide deacetylase family protein [Mycobacteriales bacterium]